MKFFATAACAALAVMGGQQTVLAEDEPLGTVIGIDLGTTYSCVGVYKNGHVEILPNDQGNRITPSYVAWDFDSGDRLIGDAAKNQATINPENTVFDAKRMIGRSWSDPALQKDREYFPFTTKSINGKYTSPPNQSTVNTSIDDFIEEFTGVILPLS